MNIMNGLNVLLWTISIILIIGTVLVITFLFYSIVVRRKDFKEYQKNHSLLAKLEEERAERDRLLKTQQNLN